MGIQATTKAIAEVKRLQKARRRGQAAQGLRIGIRGGGCNRLFVSVRVGRRATAQHRQSVRVWRRRSHFVDPKSLVLA